PVEGCVCIHQVVLLGDAIVLIQEFVDAPNVSTSLPDTQERWRTSAFTLSFLRKLIDLVEALHERGVAHGDLKPDNILDVHPTEPDPRLVDLLDFSPHDDGEIRSTAYVPEFGGRFERDRFAVTKIAEELLSYLEVSAEDLGKISAAIQACRVGPPENATLLPLAEALDEVLQPRALHSRRQISI